MATTAKSTSKHVNQVPGLNPHAIPVHIPTLKWLPYNLNMDRIMEEQVFSAGITQHLFASRN